MQPLRQWSTSQCRSSFVLSEPALAAAGGKKKKKKKRRRRKKKKKKGKEKKKKKKRRGKRRKTRRRRRGRKRTERKRRTKTRKDKEEQEKKKKNKVSQVGTNSRFPPNTTGHLEITISFLSCLLPYRHLESEKFLGFGINNEVG